MASVVGAYARAFADVVVSRKLDPALMLQELRAAEALLAESLQLRRVMENPSIPGDRKRAVLDAIAQRLGMSRPSRNFIAVVTDHRRLPLLADIVKQVAQELNNRLGIADAEVISVRELSEAEKKLLEGEVAKLTGKRVRARYQRDPSLLGGAVVKVGSTIYDGSVKGQLERIREQLVES
ncbi:MAG: ATP synthase F1 subunit delta [Terriglobales bacterium]